MSARWRWILAVIALFGAASISSGGEASAQVAVARAVDAVFVSGSGDGGIYIVYSDGRVDPRDGLDHHGDRPPLEPHEAVVAIAALNDGTGYWLFTSLGRAFGFGSAQHHGDLSDFALAAPIIAATARPDGTGYWMVGADGGIFAFGTARFYGSVPEVLPGVELAAPVIGISPSATGRGYILVAADGGIFAFGDARFHGSIPGVLPGVPLAAPVVGVVPQTGGYLMVASDGGVFNFGQSTFYGSLADIDVLPIAAIAVPPGDIGYTMIDELGTPYPLGLATMLNWGYRVISGEGSGEGDVSALFLYEQPWGRPSLVVYEMSVEDRIYAQWPAVTALAGSPPAVAGLTHPKGGEPSGFLIPEYFSPRWPIEQIGVNAGRGVSFTLRLAPPWYTPWLRPGEFATAANESIWVIDSDHPQVEVVITMDTPKDLIAEYYPDDATAAPISVSTWEGVPIDSRSAVVPGDGVLVVRSSIGYTVAVRDVG